MSGTVSPHRFEPERTPLVAACAGGLIVMLAVDFLLHAVLLSGWWSATATFWRPPRELFRHIPYAYAAFALYAAGLGWLLIRLRGGHPAPRAAALFGACAGVFVGSTGILATYSVVPLPLTALLVFPVSSGALLGAGGAAQALVLSAVRPWRRVGALTAVSFAIIVLGILIQNVLVPTDSVSHRSTTGSIPTSGR